MVMAHLKFQSKELLLTNIYAFNSPPTTFFQEATRWILKKPQYPHLIGGDFNHGPGKWGGLITPCSPLLPRFSRLPLFPWAIYTRSYINWPLAPLSPHKEYTFHSPPHKSFARLDYFFSSPSLLPHVREATIHKLAISDHSLISVQISDLFPIPTAKLWRFPSFLAQDEQLNKILEEAWEEFLDTIALTKTIPIYRKSSSSG